MEDTRPAGRACRLLLRLLDEKALSLEELACDLAVTPSVLESYRANQQYMPLDRQLCLALMVIERFPRMARLGHALRGQAIAAIRFNERLTALHTDPTIAFDPVRRFR